jgi:hypothetical protein
MMGVILPSVVRTSVVAPVVIISLFFVCSALTCFVSIFSNLLVKMFLRHFYHNPWVSTLKHFLGRNDTQRNDIQYNNK